MSDDWDAVRAWLALLGSANTIKKRIDAHLRQRFGMSIARFDVLAALDHAGPAGATAGDLTARLKVTEGNTTQVTAPLIAAGLVRRGTSAADGRVAIFQLTDTGKTLFDAMAAENKRLVNAAFAALSPSETGTLRRLLAALTPTVERIEERAA